VLHVLVVVFCSTSSTVVPARLISATMAKISWTIQHQQPGPRHPRATDGQRLLLAARHGPRGLAPPVGQNREEAEDALEALSRR
jgi:hypothetical protein